MKNKGKANTTKRNNFSFFIFLQIYWIFFVSYGRQYCNIISECNISFFLFCTFLKPEISFLISQYKLTRRSKVCVFLIPSNVLFSARSYFERKIIEGKFIQQRSPTLSKQFIFNYIFCSFVPFWNNYIKKDEQSLTAFK